MSTDESKAKLSNRHGTGMVIIINFETVLPEKHFFFLFADPLQSSG